jgi:hypothetical protein
MRFRARPSGAESSRSSSPGRPLTSAEASFLLPALVRVSTLNLALLCALLVTLALQPALAAPAKSVKPAAKPSPATKPAPAAKASSATPPSILLVTIDTLRADHVGCYGARGGSTPSLDGIAREGVRFDEARSHAPLTLPSHATILSGLDPHPPAALQRPQVARQRGAVHDQAVGHPAQRRPLAERQRHHDGKLGGVDAARRQRRLIELGDRPCRLAQVEAGAVAGGIRRLGVTVRFHK